MRPLLLALLVAMQPSPVQTKANAVLSTGPNVATTWDSNTTDGNAYVVGVVWKGAFTINSVDDSQGNSALDCGAGRLARPVDGFLQLLGVKNIVGGGTPTVTVHFSGAATEVDVYLLEYRDADPTTLFDSVTATGTATSGTSVTTGSFTPTVREGAVVALAYTNDTNASAGPNMIIRLNPAGTGEGIEDRIFGNFLPAITASMTLSAAVTKAGIIAAVIRGKDTSPGPLLGSLFVGRKGAVGA